MYYKIYEILTLTLPILNETVAVNPSPIYLIHDPYNGFQTSKIRKVEPVDSSFTTCNVDSTILQRDQSTMMVRDGCDLSP